MQLFASVTASPDEVRAARAGDDLVAPADVVMDRAFTLDVAPDVVWPWIVQLGKKRAGWYLPRRVERFVPPSRRAIRRVGAAWQALQVGDVIPDYGGADATFEVAIIEAPRVIVYVSTRGRTEISWSITLTPIGAATRVQLRLRLSPVKRRWLANSVGDLVDAVTIAGMAAGLRERLAA